jgi:hypothetical protein
MPDFGDHEFAQQLADLPGAGEEWVKAAWPVLKRWLMAQHPNCRPEDLNGWTITLYPLAGQPRDQIWVDAVARLLAKQREIGAKIRLLQTG